MDLFSFKEKIFEYHNKTQTSFVLGATLGSYLKQNDPQFAPQNYGFSSLKKLLQDIPDVGYITEDDKSQDFRFVFIDNFVSDDLKFAESCEIVKSNIDSVEQIFLHQYLYLYLISQDKNYDCYINLSDETIKIHNLTQVDESINDIKYVKIPPISLEEIKEWANKYIFEVKINVLLDDSDVWYKNFLDNLNLINSYTKSIWLKKLKHKVVEYWIKFCSQHQINPKIGFQDFTKINKSKSFLNKNTTYVSESKNKTNYYSNSNIKNILIKAINVMPVSEILQVSIPLKYLNFKFILNPIKEDEFREMIVNAINTMHEVDALHLSIPLKYIVEFK